MSGEFALRRARPLLGTLVEIGLTADDADRGQQAINAAFEQVARIQRLMSFHDPASELSRLNGAMPGEVLSVTPELYAVLSAALRFAHLSDGLFDPTVAPRLCTLGYLPRHGFIGDGVGDWRDIELLPGNRVCLHRPLHLDLGGIAKGYAVDRALACLRERGIDQAVVNAGGDLAVLGETAVPVHVRHPHDPIRYLHLAELRRGAVASSAGYFSARQHLGAWVTPLLNPRSQACLGLDVSISVFAADCMTADALTKVVAADPDGADAVLASCAAHACVLRIDEGATVMPTWLSGRAWREPCAVGREAVRRV